MIELIDAEVGDPAAIDRGLSRLMLEAMREAERDEELRERLGRLLEGYRVFMVDAVGRVNPAAPCVPTSRRRRSRR